LAIGNGAGISSSTIVALEDISIGDQVFIGGDCKIYDTDFHQLQPQARLQNIGRVPSAPIRIGPRAFIGGHCIILKGVSVGEESVIGAGSVVTCCVPAAEVWAGVPARFIRRVDPVRL
jgi:acetyltransferase-like isoleucine patch superfamily enzyme